MDRRAFTTALLAFAPAALLPGAASAAKARPVARGEAETAAAIISQYRTSQGQGPVGVDARLNAIASAHARSMASIGWMSHGDFAGRMAGYPARTAAENLAYGSNDVAGAIAQWRGSSAHNTNLLLPGARRIGVGRADGAFTRYWAMVIVG